jgi:hypothetical protein
MKQQQWLHKVKTKSSWMLLLLLLLLLQWVTILMS